MLGATLQSDCQEIARGLEVASRLLPNRGMTVWPFVTLVVAAPAFGAPLARVREMPVRRTVRAGAVRHGDPHALPLLRHRGGRDRGRGGGGSAHLGFRVCTVAYMAVLRASAGGGGSRVPGARARPLLAAREPGESAVRRLAAGRGPPGLDPAAGPAEVHACRPRRAVPAGFLRPPGVRVRGPAPDRAWPGAGSARRNYRVRGTDSSRSGSQAGGITPSGRRWAGHGGCSPLGP